LSPQPFRFRASSKGGGGRRLVGVLVLVGLLGSGAWGGEEARGGGRATDVRDTHERLNRIYKKLGIEREEKKPIPREDGCNRGEREQSSPRVRTPGLTPSMPPFLGYLLIAITTIAMLIPLYYALRSSYRDAPRAVAAAEEAETPSAAPSREGPWTVDLSECRRLIEAGKLAEAFAALHRLTLLAYQRNHQLTLDETTTNWEYVRRLASKPALRQTLSGVTLAAEQSVLGKRPPDKERYLGLERQVIETTGAAPRGTGVGAPRSGRDPQASRGEG
jgi:hypothetical protein